MMVSDATLAKAAEREISVGWYKDLCLYRAYVAQSPERGNYRCARPKATELHWKRTCLDESSLGIVNRLRVRRWDF